MSNKEIYIEKVFYLIVGIFSGFMLGYQLGLVEVEKLYTAVLTSLTKLL
jgi:hypothetical protein